MRALKAVNALSLEPLSLKGKPQPERLGPEVLQTTSSVGSRRHRCLDRPLIIAKVPVPGLGTVWPAIVVGVTVFFLGHRVPHKSDVAGTALRVLCCVVRKRPPANNNMVFAPP